MLAEASLVLMVLHDSLLLITFGVHLIVLIYNVHIWTETCKNTPECPLGVNPFIKKSFRNWSRLRQFSHQIWLVC